MSSKQSLGTRRKIYRSLCLVLSDRIDQIGWDEFTSADWELFSQMANREGVAPLMYCKLKDSPIKVPPSTFNFLRSAYYQTLAQNTLIYQEIERILKVLDEARIPVIVLKGVALAATAYEDIGLRPMSDIDILLPRQSVEEAEQIVSELGYTKNLPHRLPEIWKRTNYCISLEKQVGLSNLELEIHWGLVAGDTDWRSPSLDWFYRRTEAIRISQQNFQSGSRHLILTPTAHLLYLSAHLMLQHGGSQARLIWLYDLHLLVCHIRSRLDFEELIKVAQEIHWTPALKDALSASNSCFNTYLPPEIRVTGSPSTDNDSHRMVQRKKQSLQTRTLNVWDGLVSLDWNTRFRLLLGLIFPHPSYMRSRYALSPEWLWPLSYPYRWIDILKNVFVTSLNLIRERSVSQKKSS
jgi:hypothetical protein